MDIRVGRHTANYPDDFIVVFIGFRINKFWKFSEWLPVFRAAKAMTMNALKLPGQPLLHSYRVWNLDDPRTIFLIQHWRSFEALMEWSHNKSLDHQPAMGDFMRRTGYNGVVGIWHEVYKVDKGQFEAIYANMPQMSLAAAGDYRTLRETSTAGERMGDPKAS